MFTLSGVQFTASLDDRIVGPFKDRPVGLSFVLGQAGSTPNQPSTRPVLPKPFEPSKALSVSPAATGSWP